MQKGGIGSRLLVAAWGIPLLLGFTWLGGWWTALLIAGIAFIAQIEYYRLMQAMGRNPAKVVGLAAGLAIVACWQVGAIEAIGWAMVSLFVLVALDTLLTRRTHSDLLATFGGVCYPPLLGGSFLLLRNYPGEEMESRGLALGVWGAIWICDTAAYVGGKWTGRHPLAPAISPKKTVEGFVWGAFGAGLFSLGWWWCGLLSWDLAVVLAISAGLVGQLGDLFESQLKREAGVKDSGVLLPGHGGALDRFDSLFLAAPVIAMYLNFRDYFQF